MRFNPDKLRELLTAFLGETADTIFSNDHTRAWIFPRVAGTPIHLQIDGDRCDVFAGFTFRTVLLAGGDASEWMIIDCIEAIIEGRAVEHFGFEDSPVAIDDRSVGISGSGFEGRTVSINSGEELAKLTYAVPAWSHRPARPAEL
ncbi:hypothetical protein [Agromyces soli]|uniref:Uncharacterized protein n=1 Tax=Agromyces soli TaxID=659012 RepID=A0ABY4AV87_9MICO|nr:hypothetical protein [Agromyces soli]UOE26317.1 hypothetical protein MTP13_00635 [Agromyces soli]